MRYDFGCECGVKEERILRVVERDEKQFCKVCGKGMKRLFSPPTVTPDPDFVTEHITGEPVHVHSRKQLDDLCKRHDCAPSYGKGWY